LLTDRLKGLFKASGPDSPSAPHGSVSRASSVGQKEVLFTRQSRGLEQFFAHIRDQAGLSILDLGGVNQDNLSYLTNLGHRVSTQDFLRSLDETFGTEDLQEQASLNRINYFLAQNLDFPDFSFDGVLLWDVLQYLPPALLSVTVEKLYKIIRPGSYMLAYFSSDEKVAIVPSTSFRIQDHNSIELHQRGTRQLSQPFNNRSLEKLFAPFESVKFFLTRENLRELIVKR
jgi:hypothetical protein